MKDLTKLRDNVNLPASNATRAVLLAGLLEFIQLRDAILPPLPTKEQIVAACIPACLIGNEPDADTVTQFLSSLAAQDVETLAAKANLESDVDTLARELRARNFSVPAGTASARFRAASEALALPGFIGAPRSKPVWNW